MKTFNLECDGFCWQMPSEQLDYLRSAPIRRLRHPLDDSPLWGLLGSTLLGLLALIVGLPVLILLVAVLPLVLGLRWLLLLLYWNRRRAQYADGKSILCLLYTSRCV